MPAFGEEEMSRTFLIVIVLVALIATILSISAPDRVSRPRPTFQPADTALTRTSLTTLQAHQPPIPLVRISATMPTPAVAPREAMADTDRRPTDDSAKRAAAKAAIEADGYKGATVLSKGGDGAWRGKAFRGATEVQLIVDDSGRVSAE
jgi:hypothetical protein